MISILKTNILTALTLTSLQMSAQSYITYNHDETKMNQITVQEIGAGSLTPTYYYNLLHNDYQKSASSKNKQSFRTIAGTSAYLQTDDADSVKSSLESRAKIEALNIADRQIDLAWLAEGTKLTSKLSDFQTNINRIVTAGGSVNDKERWNEYYNIFQTAIKVTQDAYMPNAQRKKEYLSIYADISKQNNTLILFLVQLNKKSKASEYLSSTYNKPDRKSAIASAAHNRWREAAWKVKKAVSGDGSSDNNGSSGNTIIVDE